MQEALQRGVRQMAAEWRKDLGEHPSPDTLIAYQDDELPDETAAEVRKHLVLCRECARTVLDLASFPAIQPLPGVEPLSAEEVEADWQKVMDRITTLEHQEQSEAGQGLPQAPAPPPEVARLPWRSWTPHLAAVFALLSLVLGIRLLQLHPAEPSPEVNLVVTELAPVGSSTTRGPGELEIAPDTSSLVVLLGLLDLRPFDDVRVVVRRGGPRGEVVWEQAGLSRSDLGHFSVRLPRALLESGVYHFELTGISAVGEETLAQYELNLEF